MDKTTLTVDQDTLDRFNDIKNQLDAEQSGVPDHSADTFLNALLDTWQAVEGGMYEEHVGDLERLESSVQTIEERTGRLERMVEELGA